MQIMPGDDVKPLCDFLIIMLLNLFTVLFWLLRLLLCLFPSVMYLQFGPLVNLVVLSHNFSSQIANEKINRKAGTCR